MCASRDATNGADSPNFCRQGDTQTADQELDLQFHDRSHVRLGSAFLPFLPLPLSLYRTSTRAITKAPSTTYLQDADHVAFRYPKYVVAQHLLCTNCSQT